MNDAEREEMGAEFFPRSFGCVGSLGAWLRVFIGRGRPEEGRGDQPFFGACCFCPSLFVFIFYKLENL